jgi:hypothetical protein
MPVTTIKRCQSDQNWWYTVEDCNVECYPESGTGLTITYYDGESTKKMTCTEPTVKNPLDLRSTDDFSSGERLKDLWNSYHGHTTWESLPLEEKLRWAQIVTAERMVTNCAQGETEYLIGWIRRSANKLFPRSSASYFLFLLIAERLSVREESSHV